MVINSTNINKMNKHASFILTELTEQKKRTQHITLEIQVLALGHAQKCYRVERLMGSQSFPLDLDLQRQYIYINKRYIWISLLYRSQRSSRLYN